MTSLAVQARQEAFLTPLGAEMVGALSGDGWGVQAQIAYGELTLVAPREHIIEVLTTLRDQFGFQQLLDLCGVDYPDRRERFEV
ncbi:NADH-quinone oxidoreductase subunit C, partial [Pseudomonas syringae]|uniref:NADH-quinone oxidoreductase subunit C n=1 Tax=Pseudomonas syringae TaxID=317 RepID=UPI000AC8C8B6